jgi:glycosyltransferase involved in cell wall biosynthesis
MRTSGMNTVPTLLRSRKITVWKKVKSLILPIASWQRSFLFFLFPVVRKMVCEEYGNIKLKEPAPIGNPPSPAISYILLATSDTDLSAAVSSLSVTGKSEILLVVRKGTVLPDTPPARCFYFEKEGTVAAINNAVRSASGDYLVFVESTVRITKDTVFNLIGSLENRGDVALATGMALSSTKTIFACGETLNPDGTITCIGRKKNSLRPEYNYHSSVMFPSANLFAVKASLLKKIGPFNEAYHSWTAANYDYCLSINKEGFRTVYNPLARFFVPKNQTRKIVDPDFTLLRDTWKIAFKNRILHSPLLSSPAYKRILFVEDRIPDPSFGAGFPRSYELLSTLAKSNDFVTFFPTVSQKIVPGVTEHFQSLSVEVMYAPSRFDLCFSSFLKKRKSFYDSIIISRPNNMRDLATIVRKYSPASRLIYDAEALFSLRSIGREECLKKRILSPVEKDRIITPEIALIKKADTVLAVSENEKTLLKKYGVPSIYILGNSVEPHFDGPAFTSRTGMLFTGKIVPGSPNEDSLLYFIRDIYPLIRKTMAVDLTIIGEITSDALKKNAPPGIEIKGRVADLSSYYDRCKIMVAPTRFAAGIPQKIGDASARGVPCVVSPLLAEQLHWKNGKEVLVGETAEQFARCCIQLLTDERLWEQIRINAYNKVLSDCNNERFIKTLLSITSGEEMTTA